MKKLLGLALVPVVLAMTVPAFAASPVKTMDHADKQMKQGYQQGTMTQQARHEQSIYGTEAHQTFTKAQWELVERNYPEAIRLFENVIALNPEHVPSLHGLAIAKQMRGEYVDGLRYINRAIDLDPVSPELVLTKARILDAQKMDAPALEAYLTFLSLDPTDSSVLEVQRRADELFTRWEARLTPEQKEYFTGLRLLSMDQPMQAIPSLKRFIELNEGQATANGRTEIRPEVVNAHLLLSLAHQRLNQPTEAVAVLQEVVRETQNVNTPAIAPLKARTYFELSSNYGLVGQKQEAKAAWMNFVKFAPRSEAVNVLEQPFIR